MTLVKKFFGISSAGVLLVALGFTAATAADNPLKNYWTSGNGETGGYIQGSVLTGDIDPLSSSYDTATTTGAKNPATGIIYRGSSGANQDWDFEEVVGAKFKIGRDWGKLRLDLAFAAYQGNLETIGGKAVFNGSGSCSSARPHNTSQDDCMPDNEGYFGYGTVNAYWDIYRFDLHRFTDNSTWAWNAAITPYVGGGWGYGGGYMEGYKNNETPGIPISNRRAGGGEVTNFEGGVLINLTSWLGVTASYNWVDMNFGGKEDGDDVDTELHLMEAGVRLTF